MALKFRFVEDFIDPKTGYPYEGIESPKWVNINGIGQCYLHRIARVVVTKRKEKRRTTTVDALGHTIEGPEEEVEVYEESMGELGGWIDKMSNLSQSGGCWVYGSASGGGGILGDAFVSENAQVKGAVTGNARVYGNARVNGGVIGGHAQVYGNAEISGEPSIGGYARVEGKVKGSKKTSVSENALVGATGEVNGSEVTVSGDAMVFGRVTERATVTGSAIIYGGVGDEALVDGYAMVMSDGRVGKKAHVGGASIIYAGAVKDQARVGEGQPRVDDVRAEVKGSSRLSGNAVLRGKMEADAVVTGNASVNQNGMVQVASMVGDNCVVMAEGSLSKSTGMGMATIGGSMLKSSAGGNSWLDNNSSLTKSTVGGTSTVAGTMVDSGVDGGIMLGQMEKSSLSGGSIMTESISKSSISGSAYVGGTLSNSSVKGNAVVATGASVTESSVDGNARVAYSLSKSAITGNGLAGAYLSKSSLSDNAVGMDNGSGSENEVVLSSSQKADRRPDGAAVVILVDKGD